MISYIITAIIILGAFIYLCRAVYKAVKGKGSCGCACSCSSKSCPSNKKDK